MIFFKVAVLVSVAFGGIQGQQTRGPTNTLVVVGDNARLRCWYRAKGCDQIKWQKQLASGGVANISDGNVVHDNGKYSLNVSSFCDLIISNVQYSDAGTFVCTTPRSTPWLADLIVLQSAKPSCSTSCVSDATAEKDTVNGTCQLTYSSTVRPKVSWRKIQTREEVSDVTSQTVDRRTASQTFSKEVPATGMAPLVCTAEFHFNPTPVGLRAKNVPNVTCETKSCRVLYSARNVETRPRLYVSPGETVTCTAGGNPGPRFVWQWKAKGGDGAWMNVSGGIGNTVEAFLNNGTSTKLQCFAWNTFRGKNYTAHSAEITVSKDGATKRIAIIVGAVFGVVILVVIAIVIYKVCHRGGYNSL